MTNGLGLYDYDNNSGIPFSMLPNPDGSYSFGIATAAGASVDVYVQDQTTPNFYIFFSKAKATPTTLVNAVAIGDNTMVITSATSWANGDTAGVFYGAANRYYFGRVLNVSGTTITLDTPFDYAFPAGSIAATTTINMNVNGSVTPQVFSMQGAGTGATAKVDVTRIIIRMITSGAPDLTKFGDIIGGITRGVVIRKKDGTYKNLFNIKTKGDIGNIAYDLSIFSASNPAQGQNGLLARATFSGQEKTGVVIRLLPGEELQAIIQDDLTSLTRFSIMAQGHEVED